MNQTSTQRGFDAGQSFHQMYQMGLRTTQNVCTIATMPVEYALRPFFGTRYFDPIQMILAYALMIVLSVAGGIGSYARFSGHAPSAGLIGLGTISFLFFAGQCVHGPRIWRRMIHMEREQHSEYEGPALPFFSRLPYGTEFWLVRIVHEPLFVALAAISLKVIHLLDGPATAYFLVTAVMLSIKHFLGWYQNWLHLRTLMDAKFAGPLVAKAAQGKATESELAQVHLAGFPKGVPADVRTAAIAEKAASTPSLPAHIAQLISPVERAEVGVR